MEFYMESFRKLRTAAGLSQQNMANYLEITQNAYSRYERGVNELPIRHLVSLCIFFNVSSDEILGIKLR